MPFEGSAIPVDAIVNAAEDVLLDVVDAIGWSPRLELRRFADEL